MGLVMVWTLLMLTGILGLVMISIRNERQAINRALRAALESKLGGPWRR